ncbi:MAG: formate dehydrogenase accessory protein FdhE [Thermodesulfobacterium geofontis]|uniref:Formate dehydrogenase accessory protein FdhE n=1 Tax=Thermodesulfobacterium geofontis TaxID=1295609 RepID=A0A2N7PPZ8_9BACT|nr:MAG: formate dehydrogenase accessory protein FdhE [Thermodesulfobacterium geofontis]
MEIENIIENLKEERPYLKSPLELYERVLKFNKNCEKILKNQLQNSLLDQIIDEFSSIFEIPYEFSSFLKSSILNSGKDPFKEPKIILELPISKEESSKEEIKRTLFILSKPFFKKYRENLKRKKKAEETGRCGVCEEPISLTMIDSNNRRYVVCTVCGNKEEIFRIGCTHCLQRICEKIDLLVDEEEIRVELCKDCKTYIKSFKEEVYLKYKDPYLIDIISLPLDVVAQERGYIRRSPNIIGIKEIV